MYREDFPEFADKELKARNGQDDLEVSTDEYLSLSPEERAERWPQQDADTRARIEEIKKRLGNSR